MLARFRRLSMRGKALVVAILLLATSGVVLGAGRYSRRVPTIPIAEIKRGEFLDSEQFRGEMKALRSVTINAPGDAGELEILKLAADGTVVKPGDMVVEFDKTKTEQDLAQFRSALRSAQAEIDQMRAQARLTEEEDQTALMKAQYDVEAAKLDASKKEILSNIDGEEARLKLADAEQKLREAETKLKSDKTLNVSNIQSKVQASSKATYDVQRAEHALTKMTLTASSPGMISLVRRWRPEGESPFKAGERVWPGASIAEVPDVSSMRISARVDETERGRLMLNQPVTIQLDAIPERQITGHVESISTIATMDFSSGWPFPRNFDLEISLDQTDPRMKPGMTAQITVIVDRVANALTIPAQALFQRSGRNVVYVWGGSQFEERVVEIRKRSGDRVLIANGVNPDERVALKDPTVKE